MRLLKCLKSEELLEYVSIYKELSLVSRVSTRVHVFSCKSCSQKREEIQAMWDSYLTPQPDITSSILSVYSRLQKDETLILKGWKLGETHARKDSWVDYFLKEGWIFRSAVSMGVAAVFAFVIATKLGFNQPSEVTLPNSSLPKSPLAQIRVQEKNRVKVHYMEPELLQTIEFETTRGTR